MIEIINRIEDAGRTVPGPREVAERSLVSAQQLVFEDYQAVGGRVAEMASQRSVAAGEDLLRLERVVTQAYAELDASIAALLEITGYERKLGLDVSSKSATWDSMLEERASVLAGQARVAKERLTEVSAELEKLEAGEGGELRLQQRALRERLHGATGSIAATIDIMNARGLDATEYKKLLIESSGTITADILDRRVAAGLLRDAWGAAKRWMGANLPQLAFNVLAFALIIFVFHILARLTHRVVGHAVARTKARMPELLRKMAATVASKAVLIAGLLVALSQLGIQVGPLLAGLGIVGFIVGFALQNTLSNFAAGMMILVYRPFDVGDTVAAAGVLGIIADMSWVSTTIRTFDNERLIVPNGRIWDDVIRNKTAEETRRVDLKFSISYSDDPARAEQALIEIVRGHDRVLDEPEPVIRLSELAESSVDFIVRPWVRTEDYWAVYWDITRAVRDRFPQDGLTIPFPTRTVVVTGSTVAGG